MNSASKTIPSWLVKHLKSPVDGISIRYATRGKETAKVRIIFLNGRSEWIEKYADLPESTKFGEDSFWVMMDHRGQGASEGARSHVKSYEHFAKDVAAVVSECFGDQPYYIIAHSMGGLIAVYGAVKDILKPQGLVLCSPLFGIISPMPPILAKVLARFLTLTPFAGRPSGRGSDRRKTFSGNPLTSSKRRFRAMTEGTYSTQAPTFAWVHATFAASAVIYKKRNLKKLKIPVSIIVGDRESVVDRFVYQLWIDRWQELSGKTAKFKLVAGAQHELLNEADRFRKQALTFINQSVILPMKK
jgi:lysophospholipase